MCPNCQEQFELKSHAQPKVRKIVDGAYGTMMERLRAAGNPNLFLLQYDRAALRVRNLIVIPKYFFVPEYIERRKPLASTAHRAGWVGCNILVHAIPPSGHIAMILGGLPEPASGVLAKWRAAAFLQGQTDLTSRGWLLAIIGCIDALGQRDFSL